MILEISKHGLNFGENLEYISTFIKGKTKPKIENYRLLFKGVKTGKEYILFISTTENFFGRERVRLEYLDGGFWKVISPDHIKFKNYNYYKLGVDTNSVEEFFETWKKSDPMIYSGDGFHQFISKVDGYTWTYKFNNKLF